MSSQDHGHDRPPSDLRRHIREEHRLMAGGKIAYLAEFHYQLHNRDERPPVYHSDALGTVTIPED
jgi:hypothetical protein